MVDRGGNFEGWSGSPQSNASSSSYPSSTPNNNNNFNSHRQVYMQELQNFSTNFVHFTNGYPPSHYGPLPAHHHAQPQGQPRTGIPYGGQPLPAHVRSNPYQGHYPAPRAHPPPHPHHHIPQQQQQQHIGHYGNNGSSYHPLQQQQQQQPAVYHHHQQQPQPPPNYAHHHHHPPPPPHHHMSEKPHYNNGGGYYKHHRDYGPPHGPYPGPQATPPSYGPYEAPMNLTPKSAAAAAERTILNTPNYPSLKSTASITTTTTTTTTKAETISVPTCIPIQEPIQPPPMITPLVSWKRKASGELEEQYSGMAAPKRPKEDIGLHSIPNTTPSATTRELKENAASVLDKSQPPGSTFASLRPEDTSSSSLNNKDCSTNPSSSLKAPRKKKEASLKQVQQQVLQEQQQIMRIKGSGGGDNLKHGGPPSAPGMEHHYQLYPQQTHPLILASSSIKGETNGLGRPVASPPYPPPPNAVPPIYPPPPQAYGQYNPYAGGQPTYYKPNSPSYPPPPTLPERVSAEKGCSKSPQIPPPGAPALTSAPASVPQPVKTTSSSSSSTSVSSTSLPPKKGGTLWALPIVPKLPQKPLLKDRKPAGPPPSLKKDSSNPPTSVKDVWLSAFGANKSSTNSNNNSSSKKTQENGSSSSSSGASSKPPSPPNQTSSILASHLASTPPSNTSSSISPLVQPLNVAVKKVHKTYLDIPPELRRRPRPNFGGIIHFAPDWEKAVRLHHEKCRLPEQLVSGMSISSPKILKAAGKSSSSSPGGDEQMDSEDGPYSISSLSVPLSFENSNPEDDISPQRPSSMTSPFSTSAEAPRAVNNVVDSILENRKKLRTTMGRMYKKPFFKDRKRRKSNSGGGGGSEDDDHSDSEEGHNALMPTPGLPLPNSHPSEILMGSNYGNFRRQTLLRYLEMDTFSDLKAKMLDWKPEVFETKTRRQSHQVRAVTAYREIFGIDLPERFTNGKSSSPLKKKKRPYVKKADREAAVLPKKEEEEAAEEELQPPRVDIKKEVILEEEGPLPTSSTSESVPTIAKGMPPLLSSSRLQTPSYRSPLPSSRGSSKKSSMRKTARLETPEEEDEDLREPTREEEELQAELQSFALELLDSNPSWSEKVVIKNLVIWEPVDPVPYVPEKKPKKYYHRKARKRKSGMDFNYSSRTKKTVTKSRVGTPEPTEVVDVLYTLDHVMAESKSWVIDKGAGETILHRAAKMGYPDVVAYALDMLKIPPSIKDNAGIPPIHKAAFRGHGHIVNYLLRYGEDPNTNVKGTRPLHEALEGGDPLAVYHLLTYGSDPLLYDYSGNMPIDLTEGDEDMRGYLSGILADLHGKPSARWNISHVKDFVNPPEDLRDFDDDNDGNSEQDVLLEFECSASPLPPTYQFKEHPGHFVKASDLTALPESIREASFLLDMPLEDFIKNSHCCLLGGPLPREEEDLPEDKEEEEELVVRLIRLDEALRKHLGISKETLRLHGKD